MQDNDVFTEEKTEGLESPFKDEEAEGGEEPKAAKKGRKRLAATDPANPSGRLFAPTQEELQAEERRKHDTLIGLLIGPKNLVKLRTFGYDVSKVSDNALSSGVAHRGLAE